MTKQELLSMGYRLLDKSNEFIYAKPVGFTIFIFDFHSLMIANWFSAFDTGKLICNNQKRIESLIDIQHFEQYNVYHDGCGITCEFLSIEDFYESVL